MSYLVVLKISPTGKLEKYQDFDTREKAEAHVEKFIEAFPGIFIIDNPPGYRSGYETVDPVAKTLTYDHAQHIADIDMERWKQGMDEADKSIDGGPTMSRELEEHIRDEHGGVAATPEKKSKYEAKILLRGKRPTK